MAKTFVSAALFPLVTTAVLACQSIPVQESFREVDSYDVRKEINEVPEKAAGLLMAYPGPQSVQTPAPRGYKPFYISHFGRHGSRFLTSKGPCNNAFDILNAAEDAGALSPLGKDVLDKVTFVRSEMKDRYGELTSLGQEQHCGIAGRMFASYPEVFKGDAIVRANSTTSGRVMTSMYAFCSELLRHNPDIRLSFDSSRRDGEFVSHLTSASDKYRESERWYSEFDAFKRERIHPDRLVESLVADSTYQLDRTMLYGCLFDIASNLQDCPDIDFKLLDIFTDDELFELWEMGNYEYYSGRCAGPERAGDTLLKAAVPMLEDMIYKADKAIISGSNGADLRFSHDSYLVPLATCLRLDGTTARENDPDRYCKVFANYKVSPMAGNVQLVFFRNRKGEVIVKFLLNENEVGIPIETDMYPYYRWEEVKAYYRECYFPSTAPEEMRGGLPLANFALAAQIPEKGELFGHVWANTGKLGRWLRDAGSIGVKVGGRPVSEYEIRTQDRNFPIATASYRGHSIRFKTKAFCPVVAQNGDDTALPVIMLQIKSSGKNEVSVDLPEKFSRFDGEDGRMALVYWDSLWTSASRFSDAQQIGRYALDNWDILEESTRAFAQSMPRTGNDIIDRNLQYYLLPAFILTRIRRDGVTLTMGYNELNQRDSYWTSWMHLVNFKDMEWKMIEESYSKMTPGGKIPTTIFPKIDRMDDLDINLYLILRTARYVAYWDELEKVRDLWPDIKKVMDWVVSRDFAGNGLPEQVSEWCDWKDVSYMVGRRYSPYVAMLYMTSLDQMCKMAHIAGDRESEDRYRSLYEKAYAMVNRHVSEGGLWNGNYYAQVMKDGSWWPQITQDQMIGAFFGVIPQERTESIMNYLDTYATTRWGVCVMWPYLKKKTDAGGYYHNGAMWPWVSFMDCWARIICGHGDRAFELAEMVINADIIDSGDYVPNEHISTVDGKNNGVPIQGWNANLFGLSYFLQHGCKFML